MKQKIIKKMSTGETVDLSKLNHKNLKKLHYDEEKYVAHKLLEMKSFSKERLTFMQQGYALVNVIMPWYLSKVNMSYGADEQSTGMVCELLRSRNGKKLVYEAGVGTGYSCKRFVELPDVEVRGCDIILDEKIKRLMKTNNNILVDEDTLYSSLERMEDNSIDCFYADNVFEHLFPDEFPLIMKRLSRKIKKGGLLILVIPNRLVGPGDVSKYFVEKGKPAEGFHFMEMSYREALLRFRQYGIEADYVIWKDRFGNLKLKQDKSGFWNAIKLFAEYVISCCVKKPEIKNRLFYRLAMAYYVLKKVN